MARLLCFFRTWLFQRCYPAQAFSTVPCGTCPATCTMALDMCLRRSAEDHAQTVETAWAPLSRILAGVYDWSCMRVIFQPFHCFQRLLCRRIGGYGDWRTDTPSVSNPHTRHSGDNRRSLGSRLRLYGPIVPRNRVCGIICHYTVRCTIPALLRQTRLFHLFLFDTAYQAFWRPLPNLAILSEGVRPDGSAHPRLWYDMSITVCVPRSSAPMRLLNSSCPIRIYVRSYSSCITCSCVAASFSCRDCDWRGMGTGGCVRYAGLAVSSFDALVASAV